MNTHAVDKALDALRASAVTAALAIAAATRAEAGWSLETVDSLGIVGTFSSLELDGAGNPHVSYFDSSNRALKYAWHDGAAWHLETVHALAGRTMGYYSSLTFDGTGTPHIAYMDYTNYDLWHAWKVGGAWQTEIVASVGLVGYWCSIGYNAVADTLHISYYDYDPNDRNLMHAYKTSAGAGGWAIELVDASGDVGLYSALAIEPGGDVHISYYDKTNTDLKHAEKSGGVWTITTLDAVGADATAVGKYSAIAFDMAGEPHVSYYDETPANRDLKRAWRVAGAWSTEVVDAGGAVGLGSSIAFDSAGKLHISYHDATNRALKHAWLDPLIGAWSFELVDDPPGKVVGNSSSLQIGAGGRLRISYYNQSNTSLMYAKEL